MLRLFFSSTFLISFYIRNGRKLESRVNRQIGDRSLRNGIPRALLPRLDDSRITNSISPSSPLDRSLFDSPVEKRNWNCAAREIPIVDASANGSFGRDKTNGTEPPSPLRFPQMEEAASFHPMPSMSNHLPERYVLETLARGFHRPILHDIVSPLRLKKLPYKSRSYK